MPYVVGGGGKKKLSWSRRIEQEALRQASAYNAGSNGNKSLRGQSRGFGDVVGGRAAGTSAGPSRTPAATKSEQRPAGQQLKAEEVQELASKRRREAEAAREKAEKERVRMEKLVRERREREGERRSRDAKRVVAEAAQGRGRRTPAKKPAGDSKVLPVRPAARPAPTPKSTPKQTPRPAPTQPLQPNEADDEPLDPRTAVRAAFARREVALRAQQSSSGAPSPSASQNWVFGNAKHKRKPSQSPSSVSKAASQPGPSTRLEVTSRAVAAEEARVARQREDRAREETAKALGKAVAGWDWSVVEGKTTGKGSAKGKGNGGEKR